jgi:wobble nucleotide-excising tRNase
MNNKITSLLIIKPLLLLALVVAFKPAKTTAPSQSKNLTANEFTEEIQAMRGYFLEDQAMKIIISHKRVQSLKVALVESKSEITKELKMSFITMVKNFNNAISEFEELEKYKSKTWNNHRQKFIVLMKKVEKQQFALHKKLGNMRTTVSI